MFVKILKTHLHQENRFQTFQAFRTKLKPPSRHIADAVVQRCLHCFSTPKDPKCVSGWVTRWKEGEKNPEIKETNAATTFKDW